MKKLIQQIKNIIQRLFTEIKFNRYLKKLDKKSIAIDCGANVGEISYKLAKTGAKVFAFEPNPFAFKRLTERVKDFSNVICINKGVWDKNISTQLYFHEQAEGDEEFWSFGSSIIKKKGNVNEGRSVNIELIDLAEFIEDLNCNVDLLKIDIEGAECEVLEKFFEKDLHKRVSITLVETHDKKIPGQKERTDRLRQIIKSRNISNVDLSWL